MLSKGEYFCEMKEERAVGHPSVIVSEVGGGMLPYEFFIDFVVEEDEYRCFSGTIRVQDGIRIPATVVIDNDTEEAILHI